MTGEGADVIENLTPQQLECEPLSVASRVDGDSGNATDEENPA